MAKAEITLTLKPAGASLETIARDLAKMDHAKVKELFRSRLLDAARPVVPLVQASVLAIPAAGEKHSGLRLRIARCVQTASWDNRDDQVNVAVEVDPKKMPPHELGLPLYMEGVAEGRHDRWRHPVYGHSRRAWAQQPAHPYFYQAARAFGPAAGLAMRRAVDDITREING